MVDSKGMTELLFGTVPDKRWRPRTGLMELAEKHPGPALAIAQQCSEWADTLGEELTPQQRFLLGKLAVVELVSAVLLQKLATTGPLDEKGNPVELVGTVRQYTETSLRIGRELGLVPETKEAPIDIKALWAQASRNPGDPETAPVSAEEADPGTETSPEESGAQDAREASQEGEEQ